MRYAPRAILSGILGFAAAFVVACGGSSGLLSGGQSSTLSSQLDRISSAVATGDCSGASGASQALASQVQDLPATVNPTLRANLGQGVQTVSALAQQDCLKASAPPATPTSTTTSTRTTSSAATSTRTTTSTTTSTPTTTTTSTPTTTTQPPTTSSPATTPTHPGTNTTGSGGAGLGTRSTGAGNGNGNSGNGGNGQ